MTPGLHNVLGAVQPRGAAHSEGPASKALVSRSHKQQSRGNHQLHQPALPGSVKQVGRYHSRFSQSGGGQDYGSDGQQPLQSVTTGLRLPSPKF